MIRFIIGLLLGIAIGHASSANAQSAVSIIQQSSRVEENPCAYRSASDWWRSILTCRVVDPDGRIRYVRVYAR